MSEPFCKKASPKTENTIAYNLLEIRSSSNPTTLRLYKNEWSKPEFQKDFYALIQKHGITKITINHEKHAIKLYFRIDRLAENCDIVGKSEVTIAP